MTELGQILTNLVNLVPDGLVAFFPSYSFLNALRAKWKETGVLDRWGQKKSVRYLDFHLQYPLMAVLQVFFEPQDGGSVETVLSEYTDAIRNKVSLSITFQERRLMFSINRSRIVNPPEHFCSQSLERNCPRD